MTNIVIGPTVNSGATGTGLSVTTGLSFGVGLILGFSGFTGIQFSGSGSMNESTIQSAHIAATFPGVGSLSALPSGTYTNNPVTLAGAGVVSGIGWVVKPMSATFAGTSTLAGDLENYLSASFSGSGSMSVTVTQALSASLTFAGTGGKPGV